MSEVLAEPTITSIGANAPVMELAPHRSLLSRLTKHLLHRAGSLAVTQETGFRLDEDDYNLTLASLSDLGLDNKYFQPIAEYEEIASATKPDTAISLYLNDHLSPGDKPELTFNIPLMGDKLSLPRLLGNMGVSVSVWGALWGNYNYDYRFGKSKLTPILMLNDTTNPKDRSQAANDHGEAGLVYANHSATDQKRLLTDEELAAKEVNVDICFATISQYIVLQAKRRRAGLPFLNRETITRFPQYSAKTLATNSSKGRPGLVKGRVYTPQAYSGRSTNEISLSGARAGAKRTNIGVRRGIVINRFASDGTDFKQD